ncbi:MULTISPECIES: HlyD family efflux transporter periplasmic adaptor subunit [unclassified Lysobacter]|uniref:HlyD family efflux transporter periplasmic adaptor subunit n=1 Tax=unclassified Lysobacter TaxID=2635362 RepID=UPI001BE76383|nr:MULTISPECIES: HlyD family efflux transporter periplasmic adaptor subunit [unclassified Lysobacter]MBT2748327.1 HlyD family efflux transporter periplasmic adaptor subunit [Lysobacter sp. ISL-42]MBT2749906.1 HlyD family efflux transporter periplasmic adaptor subunit [Lysobacter sp. ISL-50]MBT2781234.1 HlyD family efflux transporter periplasmic adaptor subunit [Lysobacter sp. ISL-52]
MNEVSNSESGRRPSADRLPAVPRRIRLGVHFSLVLSGLFLAGLAYALIADIPQYVDARGVLLPRGGMERVMPLRAATVRQVQVREGQTVKKGDVLLTLDPDVAIEAPNGGGDNAKGGPELVVAPSAGVVARVRAVPGMAVRADDWCVLIMRSDPEFSAIVYVPSDRVASFRQGGEVSLSLDTMPKFGSAEITGRVTKTSVLPRSPEEVGRYFPLREPAFEVVVDFQRAQLPVGMDSAYLRPGSLLTASALVNKKSLAKWAVDRATRTQ